MEVTSVPMAEYHVEIECFIFRRDGVYIAYCPSLDISSCAETYNETLSNFFEMFQLHIETCVENGTLQDDLLAHGWRLHKESLSPPTFASLMQKPEMKKLIYSNINFERVVTPARMPMLS